MNDLMKPIAPFSFGMGDRFGLQGEAQLEAVVAVRAAGLSVCPVWNKSNREHRIIGTRPDSVRAEADAAVRALRWEEDYLVDADHIGLETVEPFLASSDFYTLDVADFTGKPADTSAIEAFVKAHRHLVGQVSIPGLEPPLELTESTLRETAGKFLLAMQEAGRIYRHIADRKGAGSFVTEVSVDETDAAQSPAELLCILAMLAREKVPVQTIAPKFTGRFNKGIDYVGDLSRFSTEFEQDLCVIRYAVKAFGLPPTLKLSVHSGSDKFSLYPVIHQLLNKWNAGLHVKTAGTTWLEEVIGLAAAGGEGLAMARRLYAGAHARFDELTAPYSTVIDIDPARLPAPALVEQWSAEEFAAAIRHVRAEPAYNPHMRQLLHVGFKVAAEMGQPYLDTVRAHHREVGAGVKKNLLERHLLPIFG